MATFGQLKERRLIFKGILLFSEERKHVLIVLDLPYIDNIDIENYYLV